jgi:hypothetical protein
MACNPQEVLVEVALRAAEAARRRARAAILALATDSRRGKALRESMEIRLEQVGSDQVDGLVHLPFYWAIYYHDGRGPIQKGKFMVFFSNPDEDPRIDGGSRNYPVRVTDIRRLILSKSKFNRLVREGRIIMTKRVGPADPHPFFESAGLRGLQTEVTPIAIAEIETCIVDFLGELDLLRPKEEVAEVHLF